jgi:separase
VHPYLFNPLACNYSSQAVAPRGSARAPLTRLAARSRTTTAVAADDQLVGQKKADTSLDAASSCSVPMASTTTRSDPVAETGAPVERDAGPVLLVLSPALHALPWESIPCCHGKEVYRILSLPVACAVEAAPARQLCAGADQSEPRGTSDAGDKAGGSCGPSLTTGLSAFYVLNPSGDLLETQACFQPILEAQAHWEVRRPPCNCPRTRGN